MTDIAGLRALWATLPPPGSQDGLFFSTLEVPGAPGVRLGRNAQGPALLFALSEAGPPRANIELKNMAALFNASCQVEHEGTLTQGLFTVVVCTSLDANLHLLFLDALEPLLASVAASVDTIPVVIESLVELFRGLSRAPTTSVIGLWGELFVMQSSADPDALVKAWHQMPNDRYDFALGPHRLEVKTTVGKRHHKFTLEQLRPPEGVELWVCSIVTESSAAGLSILDLVGSIASRCTAADAASHLITGAAQALGSDVSEWGSTRYDVARAAETRMLIPHTLVPAPADPPPTVYEVRFISDLSGLTAPPVEPGSPILDALLGS